SHDVHSTCLSRPARRPPYFSDRPSSVGRQPAEANRRTRWLPMKPVAPVTATFSREDRFGIPFISIDQILAVPVDRSRQPFLESESSAPAKYLAGLAGVKKLVCDLIIGMSKHFQLDTLAACKPQYKPSYCQNRQLRFVTEIESLPGQFRPPGKLLGKHQISQRAVFDVEIIAHATAIAANKRPLAAKRRSYCAGDYPIPVQVAATIQIAATRDAHWQAICRPVALGNKVRAGLADIIGMAAPEWCILQVR